jgi:hypothetical protein
MVGAVSFDVVKVVMLKDQRVWMPAKKGQKGTKPSSDFSFAEFAKAMKLIAKLGFLKDQPLRCQDRLDLFLEFLCDQFNLVSV